MRVRQRDQPQYHQDTSRHHRELRGVQLYEGLWPSWGPSLKTFKRFHTHFDQTFETFTLQLWTAPLSQFTSKGLFELQEQHWHLLEVKVLMHWKWSRTASSDERCLNALVNLKFWRNASFFLAKISHLASRSADAHGWALSGLCESSTPWMAIHQPISQSANQQPDQIQPASEATKQTT